MQQFQEIQNLETQKKKIKRGQRRLGKVQEAQTTQLFLCSYSWLMANKDSSLVKSKNKRTLAC